MREKSKPFTTPRPRRDRRGAPRSGDVSLAIFITSVSGSKSLTSFTNCFFHLSRPPGFRRAFDAAERNGRPGRIQSQRGKESSSREKRKRRIFLCRRTARVKTRFKAIPASPPKTEGRGTLAGSKDRRERNRQKNWQMARTQVLQHLPGAGKSKIGGSKGDARGRATARGATEKGGCARATKGEGVRRNDPAEHPPAKVGGTP